MAKLTAIVRAVVTGPARERRRDRCTWWPACDWSEAPPPSMWSAMPGRYRPARKGSDRASSVAEAPYRTLAAQALPRREALTLVTTDRVADHR